LQPLTASEQVRSERVDQKASEKCRQRSYQVENRKASTTSALPSPLSFPFRAHPFSNRFSDYIPPSTGWEMSEVISTLVTFALTMLKPGGRLVFFLPTDNAECAFSSLLRLFCMSPASPVQTQFSLGEETVLMFSSLLPFSSSFFFSMQTRTSTSPPHQA
jgi:hypothetical protein